MCIKIKDDEEDIRWNAAETLRAQVNVEEQNDQSSNSSSNSGSGRQRASLFPSDLIMG